MKNKVEIKDDVFVRRETLSSYVEGGIAKATFYDWVKEGVIVPAGSKKVLKGYYKLNASLQKLGLPMVDTVQWREEKTLKDEYTRSRSLYVWILAIFVEEILLTNNESPPDNLSSKEINEMVRVYDAHRVHLDLSASPFSEDGIDYPIKDLKERLAYCGGVLQNLDFRFNKLR